MNSFSEIIDAFGGAGEFARALGIKHETARKMRQRDMISVTHWARLISAADERGIGGITHEALVGLVTHKAESVE